MQGTWVPSLGREDPLEKEMATRSSILAWEIQWTEEPLFFLLILLRLGKFKVVCLGGCFFNNKDNCNLVLCDNLQGLATVLESLSCVQLCDPMDGSPRGSSVHGISQARILVWVAISFSRGSSRPTDQTHVSCISDISRHILYH